MIETDDISIDQDKWIKWIELDPTDNNLFEIDPLLNQTKEFWSNLETECVAECCGIDAFGFWSEDIKKAAAQFDSNQLNIQFKALRQEIMLVNNKILISHRMNNLFDKRVFLKLLDHIIAAL